MRRRGRRRARSGRPGYGRGRWMRGGAKAHVDVPRAIQAAVPSRMRRQKTQSMVPDVTTSKPVSVARERRPVPGPERTRSGHDWLMAEDKRKPESSIQVSEVRPGTEGFAAVLVLAAQVLEQDRYLTRVFPAAEESHVLGAFRGARCVGFLRYLIQVIGADEGRPAVRYNGDWRGRPSWPAYRERLPPLYCPVPWLISWWFPVSPFRSCPHRLGAGGPMRRPAPCTCRRSRTVTSSLTRETAPRRGRGHRAERRVPGQLPRRLR